MSAAATIGEELVIDRALLRHVMVAPFQTVGQHRSEDAEEGAGRREAVDAEPECVLLGNSGHVLCE